MTDETLATGPELEASWKNVVPVWWLVLWRSTVLFLGGDVILVVLWELSVSSDDPIRTPPRQDLEP